MGTGHFPWEKLPEPTHSANDEGQRYVIMYHFDNALGMRQTSPCQYTEDLGKAFEILTSIKKMYGYEGGTVIDRGSRQK
jgi:hypothetical protein